VGVVLLQVHGIKETLAILQESVFNGRVWPALGALGQLQFSAMDERRPYHFPDVGMHVSAFRLTHGSAGSPPQPYPSTAYLLRAASGASGAAAAAPPAAGAGARRDDDAYALYLSDLGPDSAQGVSTNRELWQRVAPLVRRRQLRAVWIESSFTSGRPDATLYGHLTPCYLLQEMRVLASLAAAEPEPEVPEPDPMPASGGRAPGGDGGAIAIADSATKTGSGRDLGSGLAGMKTAAVGVGGAEAETPRGGSAEQQDARATATPLQPLQGLTVFVTHVKPALLRGVDMPARVAAELRAAEHTALRNEEGTCVERNDLAVEFVVVEQGQEYRF
jgi:cAMP phosphodiesterase